MTRSLRSRVEWRLRHHSQRLLLRVLGKPIYCTACGRELFRALPSVRGGRLRLMGAAESNVRVEFHSKETLRFRHLELDRCPADERPWVR